MVLDITGPDPLSKDKGDETIKLRDMLVRVFSYSD